MGEDLSRSVQVVLTTGTKDPSRARFGLEAALAAVAAGLEVTVFLSLDATVWACEPRRHPCGLPVWAVLDQVREFGASVVCCSACALDRCGAEASADGGAGASTTPGIELVGLATLMEGVARGVPTVTF